MQWRVKLCWIVSEGFNAGGPGFLESSIDRTASTPTLQLFSVVSLSLSVSRSVTGAFCLCPEGPFPTQNNTVMGP